MNALLACDRATLTMKLNVHGEAAYERSATQAEKLRSNEFSCKALSAKLISRRSFYRNPEGLSPKTIVWNRRTVTPWGWV